MNWFKRLWKDYVRGFIAHNYPPPKPRPPKPRRTNTIPPDEERCISTIGTGRPAPNPAPRCKFRRAEGERCPIHRKIWERERG
jgi:hypothetical protein